MKLIDKLLRKATENMPILVEFVDTSGARRRLDDAGLYGFCVGEAALGMDLSMLGRQEQARLVAQIDALPRNRKGIAVETFANHVREVLHETA